MEFQFYQKKMEVELRNFIVIWLVVLLSLTYCYVVGKKISEGIKRLLYVFPIVVLFLYLPFELYSFHLNFFTFFSIAWLGNSKLLLFAFGEGPLSSDPSMSLAVFQAVASLPIELQQNQPHPSPQKSKNGSTLLVYAIKVPVLAMAGYITINYRVYNHPYLLLCVACLQYYLLFEMILTLVSTLAGALLGLDLEPTFNEPYLSTSVQDFWGRRWNLNASTILRLTVHQPVKKMFTRVLGQRWATAPAVVTTFFASGLIHELMFYQLLRAKPTGEVTCYFLLHGACVAVEIEVKKIFKKWRLPWSISVLWTLGFVLVSSSWPFFAPMKRCKAYVRILHEHEAVVTFLKNAIGFK